MNVIPIGPFELAAATGFILVSGGLAFALGLGLTRSLLVATARTYLQLLALGFVLNWIFGMAGPWLVLAILAVMMTVAARTVLSRLRPGAPRVATGTFAGVFISGAAVTFTVTALLIRVEPWYDPRYVLPIAGMVLGNTMNGISLSLERLFEGFHARRAEVELRLALGASAREAGLPLVRDAFRAGMIPTLNAMTTVGIVSIPGMMTGQVLAGVDPSTGAAYQIVVMLMLSAATALGSIVSLMIGYRRAFDRGQRLII